MNLRKLYYLMLIIPLFFFYTGCSDDETVDPPVAVNEAEVLVKYLEANGDAVSTFGPMITAADVFGAIGSDGLTVIDIRTAAEYNDGHIEGAVNVLEADVLGYYETNGLESKTTVVIACVTGQTAGFVSALLRLSGKTNTFDLKWGMCSWNEATAVAWTGVMNAGKTSDFVTTATAKPAAGDLLTLDTGESDGADILSARIADVAAGGFAAAAITNETVFINPANYFIINYWADAHYSLGHIEGAIQYTPGECMGLEQDLKTIATDKEVVVYCYTGQTSAHIVAYLKVLGYDAKSLKYGVNDMNYEWATANGMTHFSTDYVENYALVTTP